MSMKKMVAIVLIGSLSVGMMGCMDKGNEKKQEKIREEKRVEPPKDPLGKYDETVTISTALPENAGIQWVDGDNYDDNPWYRAYEERLNIKVVNDWVSNDYTTKLNLTIADGDLPDVFFVQGAAISAVNRS